MVTANAERLADRAEDTLEGANITALATVGLGAAAGVTIAQRITDRIMGVLNMPIDPETPVQFGVSIGLKGLMAVAFGFLAAQVGGGLISLALAFAGLGALASAGVDVIVALLETAPLGGGTGAQRRQAQPTQNGHTATAQTRSVSSTSTSSVSASSNGQTAGATVGGM